MTGGSPLPVLWDQQDETIVNNESEEILRMLETEFDDVSDNDVDLYPEGYQDEVDRIIDDIYEPINNGVYRSGFADTSRPTTRPSRNCSTRWTTGIRPRRPAFPRRRPPDRGGHRLFTTLVRFDEVYHTHFTCNHKLSASTTPLAVPPGPLPAPRCR